MTRSSNTESRPQDASITNLLARWSEGSHGALEQLLPVVYKSLHRLAGIQMSGEGFRHTLQPTALVHELYLELAGLKDFQWSDRRHFYAMAARFMRRILIRHARRNRAQRRGAGSKRVTLDSVSPECETPTFDLIELDDALDRLEELDPIKFRVVKLRYFAGLTLEEIAPILEMSVATVWRQTELAKAWLYREIDRGKA